LTSFIAIAADCIIISVAVMYVLKLLFEGLISLLLWARDTLDFEWGFK